MFHQKNSQLFVDDSMPVLEVGPWAVEKYKKIGYYCSLFATSMKNIWDMRIYLDLFAGSGKCSIRDTKQIIPGSSLLALNISDPYDLYIFCEKDNNKIEAFQERVLRYFPDRSCEFICGDVNLCLERLFDIIPKFSPRNRGLTYCFSDPFKTREQDFNTIRSIQQVYVDFLILIPSFIDINRNESCYTRDDSMRVVYGRIIKKEARGYHEIE